jgi:hypothetical protein
MTRSCCPSCRVRFIPAAAAILSACPTCGGPLHEAATAGELLGYRLDTDDGPAAALAAALASALDNPMDTPR